MTFLLFATILVGWWLSANPVEDFSEKIPGMDNRPKGIMKSSTVNFGGYSARFAGVASDITGSWPNFRGPGRDNISREKINLANSWGSSGPSILWSVDLGEGHSGPVISNGKVYVFDYDDVRSCDKASKLLKSAVSYQL